MNCLTKYADPGLAKLSKFKFIIIPQNFYKMKLLFKN